MIQNNFFNLQTNEVMFSNNNTNSMHSPFVDIQKVFNQHVDDSKTISYNLTQDKKKVTKHSPVNPFKGNVDSTSKQDIEPSNHKRSLSEQKRNLNQEHYQQTLNTILNLEMLEPFSKCYLNVAPVFLPPVAHNRVKKVLFVDLDETMVHTLDDQDSQHMMWQHQI
jgi:Dullard-like phosphatase family protein